ncbi:MAG: MFS transporter [Candidatus Lokiarchaeota archaeon]|nr:MFS transporter [Candidatus Lokiarchaeota archaeon]
MKAEDHRKYTKDFKTLVNIVMLNTLGFFFMDFLIPIIARDRLEATLTQVGLIFSVMLIGFMISSFICGILTDIIESKVILILIGSFGRGITYFIIYFSILFDQLIGLIISNFILGFFVGFFWIPLNTLISEKSYKDNRAHAFGKRQSRSAIGQIFGTMAGIGLFYLGIFLNNHFIMFLGIPIYGITNILAGILYKLKIDESDVISKKIQISQIDRELEKVKDLEGLRKSSDSLNDNNTKNQSSKLIKSKIFFVGIILLLAVVLLSNINGTLAKPFINIYLFENIVDNFLIATFAYLPAGGFATLLAPKMGKLVDRLNPSLAIIILSASGATITWFLINTPYIWVFSILLFFDIAIVMTTDLLFSSLLSRISLTHRGKILGMSNTFINFGAIIGPVLGGFVGDLLGSRYPFIISIFVELCLIPLYLIVIRLLVPNLAEKSQIDDRQIKEEIHI